MPCALVFLCDGFEETEAVATVDILRRGAIDARTVSLTGEMAVTGSHGITVLSDALFDVGMTADVLVFPGGPGTKNYFHHEGLKLLTLAHGARGGLLAAICAAPGYLGALGLLEGRRAVCYPGCEDGLKGALVTRESVVGDGNIITANGPGAAALFGLAILERLEGRETYERTKAAFIV